MRTSTSFDNAQDTSTASEKSEQKMASFYFRATQADTPACIPRLFKLSHGPKGSTRSYYRRIQLTRRPGSFQHSQQSKPKPEAIPMIAARCNKIFSATATADVQPLPTHSAIPPRPIPRANEPEPFPPKTSRQPPPAAIRRRIVVFAYSLQKSAPKMCSQLYANTLL